MLDLLLITWALFAGLLLTRLTNYFRLPDVTAYLIVGVIIGPSVLGKLGIAGIGFNTFTQVDRLSIISDVALGFIAFAIGSEFKLSELKKTGKQAFIIGIWQAINTTIVVDIALIVMHFLMPKVVTIPMALSLGAIATATAPAATIMVVRQYKAQGPVTDILLPVVALDDAVGLIIFAASFGVANAFMTGNTNILNLIIEPLMEIIGSLLLGFIVAVILTALLKLFRSHSNRLILIIASIILTVAVAKSSFKIGSFAGSFSSLLVCMMFGTVFSNICPIADELMDSCSNWSQPLLVIFFVLSGAELNLDVIKNHLVLLIGVVYLISRSLGKYYGARISATYAKSKDVVKKYLGITLLPQAGVALGMSTIVARSFGEQGNLVRNISLFAVLVYELVGPTLTKIALTKAGDIKDIQKSALKERKF